MREEYDFSNAKKNPYAKKLKQQITINLDSEVIDFFKQMSVTSGIPYQTLINLYLSDCMYQNRQLNISWKQTKKLLSYRVAFIYWGVQRERLPLW